MNQKELSELTDQQLLDEAKKRKSNSTTNALFIGILIGIVIYSIVVNGWGFLSLILLYFIYKLITKPKDNQELEKLLKERNLK